MIEIKPIKETERDELLKVVKRYWKELMPNAIPVKDPRMGKRYFEDQFQFGKEGHYYWWAVLQDEKIGFSTIEVSKDWSSNTAAFIDDFYIEPQHRRKGLGREFVNALLEWLQGKNVYRIDLYVRTDNPRALEFWKSMGFDVALYKLRRYDLSNWKS